MKIKKIFVSTILCVLMGAMYGVVVSGCAHKAEPQKPEVFPASNFDTILHGLQVSLYTLTNQNGMAVQVTNYGARIVDLWVPSKNGDFKDVVWGYSNIKDYLDSPDVYSGPVVGRYGNRIAKGRFVLDGEEYQLTINDGENHIHGGSNGLWNRIWTARQYTNDDGEEAVEMTYFSPDGEEGYPGNMNIKVTYTVGNENTLRIDYEATSDATTIVNLTSHSYFNLHGTSAKSTNSHILTLNADSFTPTDAELIPTGDITRVENTPLDFRQPTAIGERIEADYEPLHFAKGYDHNWILNKTSNEISLAASLYEPETGIVMNVLTDQPAIQFYSGNFMNGTETGKRGDKHNYRTGVALETQNYPDAPNHSNFPSAVLKPGDTYKHVCIYEFGVQE